MKNLFRAGWRGIWRDKFFWACGGAMALSGMYLLWAGHSSAPDYPWDAGVFDSLLAAAMVVPVFCPVVFGREHSCGTLRNKLCTGRGRLEVYFTFLLLSFWGSLLFMAAYLVPYLGGSLLMGAGLSREPRYVCVLVVCSVMVLLALTSFFTMLSLLIQNRAWGIAICLALGFVMVVHGSHLRARLTMPESFAGIININYPTGTYRVALEFLYDCTLGGMVFQCAALGVESPGRVCLSALLWILLPALTGAWLFKRKDLK